MGAKRWARIASWAYVQEVYGCEVPLREDVEAVKRVLPDDPEAALAVLYQAAGEILEGTPAPEPAEEAFCVLHGLDLAMRSLSLSPDLIPEQEDLSEAIVDLIRGERLSTAVLALWDVLSSLCRGAMEYLRQRAGLSVN